MYQSFKTSFPGASALPVRSVSARQRCSAHNNCPPALGDACFRSSFHGLRVRAHLNIFHGTLRALSHLINAQLFPAPAVAGSVSHAAGALWLWGRRPQRTPTVEDSRPSGPQVLKGDREGQQVKRRRILTEPGSDLGHCVCVPTKSFRAIVRVPPPLFAQEFKK